MKRTLTAIVAAIVMITTTSAQKLTNIRAEASFITDQMIVELGLNKARRNSILNINLSYLNGINNYRDIDAYGWKHRNSSGESSRPDNGRGSASRITSTAR